MNDKHAEELIKALDEIDSTLMRIANSLSSLVSVQEGQYGS